MQCDGGQRRASSTARAFLRCVSTALRRPRKRIHQHRIRHIPCNSLIWTASKPFSESLRTVRALEVWVAKKRPVGARKMGNTLCSAASFWQRGGEVDVALEYVLQEAQTGDLILFQGRGADACFIRCVSLTPMWSHVGVVLVNHRTGAKYITEAYPTVIGSDPIRGGDHTGVQVTSLEYRLRTYPSGKLAWRPLMRVVDYAPLPGHTLGVELRQRRALPAETRSMYNAFVDFYKRLQTIPQYNWNLLDLWQYATRTDPAGDDNGGKFVCTSWAAQVLLKMGIFEERIGEGEESSVVIPGNVFLSQFGGEGPLPTKRRWRYDDAHFFRGDALKTRT